METTKNQDGCGEVRDRGPSSKFVYTRRGPRRHYFTHDAEVWDEAPKIYLTKLALREIDKRNALRKRPMKIVKQKLMTNNLSRFARRGGPDLSHLRGLSTRPVEEALATPASGVELSPESTEEASEQDPGTKSLTPYDDHFEVHLENHGVYMDDYVVQPGNVDELRLALKKRRLSASPLSMDDYQAFLEANSDACDEQAVAADVVPKMLGPEDACGYHSAEEVTMTGLDAVVEHGPFPKPYHFDGIPYPAVDKRVADELQDSIVPVPITASTGTPEYHKCPVAPNFFFEVSGPRGSGAVLERQICHYARLAIYCHYMSGPAAEGGVTSLYHMKELNEYHLSDNLDSFVEGVTALRNARSVARDVRDRLMEAANRSSREEREAVLNP
ncbi:hypothetical protein N3K66_005911 [Trichothecium roseum]|uniref:Uncharacterized protein n=1 Tax=Trichothecium roseum TaxID=47278 RepID=A0ACC0V1V9_9HYPO|nr:hypothetical protein N3K66_005911 [Trichothecium roseum]